jgi:transposase
MKIIEILRLKEMNLFTYRDIAQSVGCSKTVVGEILKRCQECNLTYESAQALTQTQINELIYPDAFGPKQVKEEPDWEDIHARLQSSRRINLQYIWEEEYRPAHPDGYSYSRFCAKYVVWKKATGKKVIFPQEREPGKEMFIDWIGDTLPCVVDRQTGEIHDAHFFVTTLGDGSYPFVEAFPDETQLNWNQGHIDALNWYGGLPRVFVPDNCKTAVVHTNLYEPSLNHAYREMACYYDIAIIPARIIKPRDKASVESCVGWLETWLIEWLKGRHYFSFEALNHDIHERVIELTKRDFKHREGSRESVFLALDKPCLRPLPEAPFESFETKMVTRIPNNYHIECKGFYYSVPYRYYDQPAVVHIFAKKIEIYSKTGERIAIHQRRFSGRRYVTDSAHMPENHKAVLEFRSYDGSYYKARATAIGTATGTFVRMLLENADFEEQAYKSCSAVINFSKTYGNLRVESACEKAIHLNSVTYTTLRNILKNGQDLQRNTKSSAGAESPTPYHENLRTGEWQ